LSYVPEPALGAGTATAQVAGHPPSRAARQPGRASTAVSEWWRWCRSLRPTARLRRPRIRAAS